MKYKRVAVHGVPRSGTTWIGEILNSSPHTAYRYQPLFSYAHKDFLTGSSSAEDVAEFFDRLLDCQDVFTNQTAKRACGALPVFEKNRLTHVVYKEVRYLNILWNLMRRAPDVLLCGVIRSPVEVIGSWLNAPREFRADLGWVDLEEWRYAPKKNMNRPEEFNGFEKWKEAANTFIHLQKAFPGRVHILCYGDLMRDPAGEAARLFDFLGLEVLEPTREFLAASSERTVADAYSVFRKREDVGAGARALRKEIADQIVRDLEGTELARYLA